MNAISENGHGASPEPLGEDSKVQLRLGHLNMVQGIIGRVAGFSATAKNFSVTLAAAAVAVNLAEDQKGLLWIALAAALLLLIIDAFYLAQEKAFRDLYDEIASRPLAEAADLISSDHPWSPSALPKASPCWRSMCPN